MGGNHFSFKQFAVSQLHCAMKVSTDACLLGAWAPFSAGITSVLDIGCGTGLLSLMTTQRFEEAQVTALELDPGAAGEAAENAAKSPWKDRIRVVPGNVLTHPFGNQTFEGIICNPPFFQKSLASPEAARHAARHDDGLPLADLFLKVEELLAATGQLALLLPPATHTFWEQQAAGSRLVQTRKVLVRPLPAKAPNRVLSFWENNTSCPEAVPEELLLYQTYGHYTPAARALLAPFLLKL